MEARSRQERRYKETRYRFNAELGVGDIKEYCALGLKEQEMMEQVFCKMKLSARAYHKIIKNDSGFRWIRRNQGAAFRRGNLLPNE